MNSAEQEPQKLINESARQSWNEHLQSNEVPQAVVFDVTNVCDSPGCAHCYINAVKHGNLENGFGNFMDINTAQVWSDTLASNPKGRPEQIWISGGEPTLHKDLGLILKFLKEKQFYTALITNGEKFEDKEFGKRLASEGNLDEVAVTIRGDGILHDLFMLPADNPIWAGVSKDGSYKEQIDFVKSKSNSVEHFEKTMEGIMNLSEVPKLKIALNIDMQAAGDMEKIVRKIKKRGGRVDNIYLQAQQETGRAKAQPGRLPNLWRKPTVDMVGEYMNQSERLLKEGSVKEIVFYRSSSSRNS